MLVSRPARGPAVAGDGPRYTNMYETKNETNPGPNVGARSEVGKIR